MNGTWRTTGGGGEGIVALAVIVGAALAVGAAVTAVGHAVAEIPAYVYVCGALVVLVIVAGLVALVVRVHRAEARRAQQFLAARRPPRQVGASRSRAIAPAAAQQHVHFHGMTPEDVAAVLRSRDEEISR